MSSKEAMLATLRQNIPSATELPPLDDSAWNTFEDKFGQFRTMLEAVGGKCEVVANVGELNECLAQIEPFAAANKICSLVDGVERASVDLHAVDDPHELEDIDFAVLPGRFAVAENAAVWVTDEEVKHRVIYFIPQHVALVIDVPAAPGSPASPGATANTGAAILDNMHQAYECIQFETPYFGLFISGPSKTADIEQSLVIGAHGPRSLTVFFVTRSNS